VIVVELTDLRQGWAGKQYANGYNDCCHGTPHRSLLKSENVIMRSLYRPD
jgi:hypothetical protein